MINLNNPENKDHDKATRNAVYFYRSQSGVFTFCPGCAEKHEMELELIDLAGDFDICSGDCEVENIPVWYHDVYRDINEQ